MEYINKAASALNTGIDTGMAYLTENAFAILVLLAIAYFIRTNGKNERRDMCVEWNGERLLVSSSLCSHRLLRCRSRQE
jgi:hypothetical protein